MKNAPPFMNQKGTLASFSHAADKCYSAFVFCDQEKHRKKFSWPPASSSYPTWNGVVPFTGVTCHQ